MCLGTRRYATRNRRPFYREIARAVASPDLKEKVAAIGYEPSAVPADEFKARIKADMPKWANVIHDAGIRP